MNKSLYSRDQQLIVKKLRKARLDLNLSQKIVSIRLGVTQSYISKIESGQVRIDVLRLNRLAKIYKKEINYFIGG